jgi:hypothetical protein
MPPVLEQELRDEGFAPLGVAKAVLRANKHTLVAQIWVADGGRVMTNGVNELVTLFEDGTIVKTSRRLSLSFQMTVWWRLRMHRADRHPHAWISGRLAALLAAHRERVALFEKETPVVVARSMTEHFAVRLRDAELREARQWPTHLLALWMTGILSCALAWLPVIWLRMHGWRARAHGPKLLVVAELTALLFVGMFIAALPLRYLTVNVVAPWIMTLRPGPPPRPAAAWMELARAVPSAKLDLPPEDDVT